MTILTNNQVKQFRTDYIHQDQPCVLIASVRYDDRCRNGHNTFSITGDLYDGPTVVRGEPSVVHENGKRLWFGCCGCLHTVIAERLPELTKHIKWHLVSTDGPMYYIANSMYHAGARNLEYARSSAAWPDAELEDFTEEKLKARLPALMIEFRKDVEELGFIY